MEQDEDRVLSLPKVEYTTPRRENYAQRTRTAYLWCVLIVAVITSLASLAVVVYSALYGSPDGQKLAYGILGTSAGILWSQAARLVGV